MTHLTPAASGGSLRDRFTADMTVRGFTDKTRNDYIRTVTGFAAFIGRSPNTATAEDIRRFQIQQSERGMNPPAMNSTVAALRFFFNHTIDRPDLARKLIRLRDPDDPRAMLVVASVMGSGRSLLEISRDLREVCRTGSIIYLVGFAKIEGEERRDALKRTLVHSHHHAQHMFEVIDELLLPGQATPNPWQQELELLQKGADAWPAGQRGWLDGRLDRLRKASKPMTDNLFVPADGASALRLQAGFAFWPKVFDHNSQADVFFKISAVMQRLRTAPVTAGDQALRTNWLQQTLLSPENFGRFNDGVIQASILRAAKAAELDYRDDAKLSDTAKRIVRRVLEAADRARGEAAVEFLIAIGCGRLRLKEDHVADVLRPIEKPPALVDAFRSVVRRELGLT